MRSLGVVLLASLAVAAVAAVAGAVVAAVRGTSAASAVALALWIAAAACLVLMFAAGNRRAPFAEGWMFFSASVLLTGLGALVDAFS